MEKFSTNNYSTHGHFRAELFIIPFALFIVGLTVFPKIRNTYGRVKLNTAIESAKIYQESINNYYVSNILSDNEIKLDGVYKIDNGNLVAGGKEYKIAVTGNVPKSGYLNYENNKLKNGCINIIGYSIKIENETITEGSCEDTIDVAILK